MCGGSHNSIDCNSGSCDPDCDFGWQSCDGNLVNGCESPRNTDPGCNNGQSYAASVSGDTTQAPVVIQSFGEARLRMRVREESSGPENLYARFRLESPDGMMRLCLRCNSCTSGRRECGPLTGDTSVIVEADNFSVDSFDTFVEIDYVSSERTACGNWRLTIYSEWDNFEDDDIVVDCDG